MLQRYSFIHSRSNGMRAPTVPWLLLAIRKRERLDIATFSTSSPLLIALPDISTAFLHIITSKTPTLPPLNEPVSLSQINKTRQAASNTYQATRTSTLVLETARLCTSATADLPIVHLAASTSAKLRTHACLAARECLQNLVVLVDGPALRIFGHRVFAGRSERGIGWHGLSA